MQKRLISGLAFCAFTSQVNAATFDIVITDISGDGAAQNVGLYETRSIGELGVGSATIAAEADFDDVVEFSNFSAKFGATTATTFFQKNFSQDLSASTITVSGSLGGLTDGSSADIVSALDYEFVYRNPNFTEIVDTHTELSTFLAGASMSGFVSAAWINFDPLTGSDVGYIQRLDFAPAPVPVPAGIALLVSGIAGLGLFRRLKNRRSDVPALSGC